MVYGSWRHWLSTAMSALAPSTRRKIRSASLSRVEGLEERSLLTTFVPRLLNNPPVVQDSAANPSEDLPFPGTVANLASDVDGDALTYTVLTQPLHGTVVLAPTTGIFTYTPELNYNGPDFFTFTATDGQEIGNVGTFALFVDPVDDALKLTFPSPAVQVPRTSSKVRIDPAANVSDLDTVVNYGKTLIRTTIVSGNSNGDNQHGRVSLSLVSQGEGPGLVFVKGGKVYFDGSSTPVATVSGGTLGRGLVIQFSKTATEESVNAVLKQISIQASKKAITGARSLQVAISAGGQKVVATRTATVV